MATEITVSPKEVGVHHQYLKPQPSKMNWIDRIDSIDDPLQTKYPGSIGHC